MILDDKNQNDILNSELINSYDIEYVFNPRMDTKIVKPKLGDSAGVFGAAFLCE